MALGDWRAVRAGLAQADALCEQGGDWERKNRLKVYKACAALAQAGPARGRGAAGRRGGDLLRDGALPLRQGRLLRGGRGRRDAREAGPKVQGRGLARGARAHAQGRAAGVAARGPPRLPVRPWLASLAVVARRVAADRLLGPHARHWVREMRRVAYSQFLESYKSVELDAMAAAFGVRPAFLDEELADLVASGAVAARVDAVSRVVTTARAEPKAAEYRELLGPGTRC